MGSSLVVRRESFRMPDAHASAFEHEKPAAGMGFPSDSPYHVGVRDATENQRNGVFKKSVPVTVVSNIRPQRRRGAPQARPSRPPFFIRSQEPARWVPSCRQRPVPVSYDHLPPADGLLPNTHFPILHITIPATTSAPSRHTSFQVAVLTPAKYWITSSMNAMAFLIRPGLAILT